MTTYPFVQAKHYRVGRTAAVRVVVCHTAETRPRPGAARAIANYFANTDKTASAHFAVDSGEVIQCVREQDTAWAAPGCNHDGIQIELCTRASTTADGWKDAYHDAMLRRAAALIRDLDHQVPYVMLSSNDLLVGRAGITGHVQVTNAYHQSTHVDPGPHFPWDRFIGYVKGDDMALTDDDLAKIRVIVREEIEAMSAGVDQEEGQNVPIAEIVRRMDARTRNMEYTFRSWPTTWPPA